tara:strand:+ start:197 stop:322 length:126 start_codon:yes stop_codon:yes gene_type:complete
MKTNVTMIFNVMLGVLAAGAFLTATDNIDFIRDNISRGFGR